MEARLRVTGAAGESVDLALKGPAKAIRELIERLGATAGPLDVTGGQCCWSMSGKGATVHLVVDTDRMAS
jgi:hypothetical protein